MSWMSSAFSIQFIVVCLICDYSFEEDEKRMSLVSICKNKW